MKNIYTAPELEIVNFEAEDIITTSIINDPDNNETAGMYGA